MSVGRLSIASVGDGCTPDIMTSILVPGDTMTERTHDQGNRSTVNRRSDATQPNLVCPERASDRAMTDEEKSEVILAVARLLYTNGQATDQVVAVIRRLAKQARDQCGTTSALGRAATARAERRDDVDVVCGCRSSRY